MIIAATEKRRLLRPAFNQASNTSSETPGGGGTRRPIKSYSPAYSDTMATAQGCPQAQSFVGHGHLSLSAGEIVYSQAAILSASESNRFSQAM